MSAQRRCAASSRRQAQLLLAATLLGAALPVRASDVDSEHLFGFTEGADIGKKGEREAESETIVRAGKSAGSYAAIIQNDQVRVVPTENFRIGANLALGYFDISGVPGLADQRLATMQGVSFEARWMLMDRRQGPFGLTLIAEPRLGRVDATTGETAANYGGTLTFVADRELIDNCLFDAVNLLYDSAATRQPLPSDWLYESRLGLSAAAAVRVSSKLFLGGEVRYLRAYDGLALNTFSGEALFAGPTLYLQIAKGVVLSAAWNVQVTGSTASGGSLDLTHFERQQAKVRFNANF